MENKLVVGIPTIGSVDWRFASSLMGLQLLPISRVIWTVKSMIYTARNNIVQETLKDSSYTHLLMVDDDMTFESDFVKRLISHDVDIVGGLAFKRRPPFDPCVYQKNPDGNYYPILPEIFREVDIVGTGGILIKTEVFKKLKYPYFETYYDEIGRSWSVDFDFCIKAKEAGFKIFCDPEAAMGHIGDSPVIGQNEYLQYVKQLGRINDINNNNNKNDSTSKNNNE